MHLRNAFSKSSIILEFKAPQDFSYLFSITECFGEIYFWYNFKFIEFHNITIIVADTVFHARAIIRVIIDSQELEGKVWIKSIKPLLGLYIHKYL